MRVLVALVVIGLLADDRHVGPQVFFVCLLFCRFAMNRKGGLLGSHRNSVLDTGKVRAECIATTALAIGVGSANVKEANKAIKRGAEKEGLPLLFLLHGENQQTGNRACDIWVR